MSYAVGTNKASAEGNAEWNEFYARLIEYCMEHGTYQVPADYVVTTEDGEKLALGAWLQVQRTKMNEYSLTKPHWHKDLLDLGKLWCNLDSEPNDQGSVLDNSTTKGMTSTINYPTAESQRQATVTAAPARDPLVETSTNIPLSEVDNAKEKVEFVAFGYRRSTTDPQHAMLGIGIVCETHNADGALCLIVMIPDVKNAPDPVKAEYRMEPHEFIMVQSNLVLARELSFENGQRGGVLDATSQAKIRSLLSAYNSLKFDTHYT